MNSRKIAWGIVLIGIGTMLVLNNFGYINFHWGSIWRFWPLILIFIGLDSLLKNTSMSKFGWLLPLVAIFSFGILFFDFKDSDTANDHLNFNWDSDSSIAIQNDQKFTLDMEPNTERAELSFAGGGAKFSMLDTTAMLIDANTISRFGDYTLEKINDNGVERLNLKMTNENVTIRKGEWTDKVDIKLNVAPIWKLKLELGAGSGDFDLSPYMIEKLKVESGAASLDITLKDNLPLTTVEVDAGASKITIRVPKSANCRLDMDAVLSSKSVEGFVKRSDDKWESEGFNASGNVIDIKLDAGVSDINIVRY